MITSSEDYKKLCSDSLIEQEFNKVLENKEIKVVSFDIFDTLVFRKVAKPTDVFLKVGKYNYVKELFQTSENFKLSRIYAEKKARQLHKKLEDITLDLIYEQLPLTKKQRNKIKKTELKEEYKNLYINKQIEIWIEKAYNKGKKVVLISDMYLYKKQIDKLVLSKVINKNYISKIYVSSEYGKSKSKGGLFPLIKNKLGIKYEEWFHIGDNIHSDINQAKKLNINTLYYNYSKKLQNTFYVEEKYINCNIKKLASLRTLSLMLNPYLSKNEQFYFNLGSCFYAPALWNFSLWLGKLSKQKGIKQINFIMREGVTFQKYFKKLNSSINTNLIYASRKSIFLASLDMENFKISDFKASSYRGIRIKDLYELYKIKLTNKVLEKYKNTLCSEVHEVIIGKKTLLSLLENDLDNNLEKIKEKIKVEKQVFKDYMNSFDIEEKSIFVDFGGSGTVLQHINNTLKEKKITSVLFYKYLSAYGKMISSKNFSFLYPTRKTEHAIKVIQRSPEFMEILLNGLEKTTTHYMRKSDKVIPITKYPHDKTDNLISIIKAFNKGIDNFFLLAKEYNFKKIIDDKSLALILSRLIEVPSKDEVAYLGDLYYDEGKASKQVQKLIPNKLLKEIKKVDIPKMYEEYSQNYWYERNKYHWITGIISKIDPYYISDTKGISPMYNIRKHANILVNILKDNNISKINIYGAGGMIPKLKPLLEQSKIEIVSIMDKMALSKEFKFEGYTVTSLPNQLDSNNNTYPILIASLSYEMEIIDYISKIINERNLHLMIISRQNGLVVI